MLTLSRAELRTGIKVAKMREEDYCRKGEGMTELTLKGETYRIRRADPGASKDIKPDSRTGQEKDT